MENKTITNKKVFYSTNGVVYGTLWGGGEGSYPTKLLVEQTKEKLIEKIKSSMSDGSLDSGMGYEKILGCGMVITKHETLMIDDKEYTNEEEEVEVFGTLTEEQTEFVLDRLYEI